MKARILFSLLLSVSLGAYANNVVTSSVALSGQNTAADYTNIKFSITWENSWRTANNESNYDGCWIFAKFRKKNASAWQHATINYGTGGTAAASGHTQPAGSTITTPTDGKGAFIYRDAVGAGTVNWADAQLRWNYGVDGVADNDSVEVKLFAVEMVYVPQGAYVLGSNGSELYHFRRGDKDTCFQVNNENSISTGTTAATLFSTTYFSSGTIPTAYPKGFNAFWCMKYETSMQQYVDFLNTVDFNTYTNRNPPGYFTGTHPNLISATPERAQHGLNTFDVLALLDWSGLRPMTEMEFEKACRGANQVPVPDEYAWGNTTWAGITSPINQGMIDETWTTGNLAIAVPVAMRTGALATATSNRQQSGATFYGIMEMSGNASDLVVSASTDGRIFTAAHGDGNLSNTGEANVPTWPTVVGGYGTRGYEFTASLGLASYCTLSTRVAMNSGTGARAAGHGGRGVRTAQ